MKVKRGTQILQYVDDLLVTGISADICKEATYSLLNSLGRWGYRASPDKFQFCLPEVLYLGHVLKQGMKKLADSRIQVIQELTLPGTKKGLRGYLGMTGFCRPWIPCYGELAKPLFAMISMDTTEPLEWRKERRKAFESLKEAVALGLPVYKKPFTMFVNERAGTASGVLTQRLGPRERPIGYFSKELDVTARGFPACLRAVAAVATLIEEAQKIVMGYPLKVKVPHEVEAILTQRAAKYLTPARHASYEAVILSNPEVTVEACTTLNPATLLPDLEKGQLDREHVCLDVLDEDLPIRKDLTDVKMDNVALELFTDGSSFMIEGKRYSGYAVVTLYDVMKAEALSAKVSAQAAELIALMEALKLAEGRTCNIFTDSR